MKSKKQLIMTTILCLLPILMTMAVYDKLPNEMAIHFDASGAPNGYASKVMAGFGLPLFLTAINFIIHIFVDADPKNAGKSEILINMGKWSIPAISLTVMPMTILYALGWNVKFETIVPIGVGILFMIIGNYLPKCRQNYTVGIKLPWTLHSEENWRRTHRLGAWAFVLSGLLFIAQGALKLNSAVIITVTLALVLVCPCVYSYTMYKKGI